MTEAIERSTRRWVPPRSRSTEAILRDGVRRAAAAFDPRWGGFGGAPKFPQPMTLEFLPADAPAWDAATRSTW